MNSSGRSSRPSLGNGSFGGLSLHDLYTEIEISVKCRGLKRTTRLTKQGIKETSWRGLGTQGTFCVLFLADQALEATERNRKHASDEPREGDIELGKTEVVWDTSDPRFVSTVKTKFVFEEKQTLIVRVYNSFDDNTDLHKSSFVGSAVLTIGEVMGARGNYVERTLEKESGVRSWTSIKSTGTVIVYGERVAKSHDRLTLELGASKLRIGEDQGALLYKPDPFFTISRMHADGEFSQIIKSEVAVDTLFPKWSPKNISLQIICNGDLDRPVKIQVWNKREKDKDGKCKELGSASTTLRTLQETDIINIFHNETVCGHLLIKQAGISAVPTFLEYISGTCTINFITGVDFSSSNRNPDQGDDLHSQSEEWNEYQAAISSVGTILQDYCVDGKCHFFGFGMKEKKTSTSYDVFAAGGQLVTEGVDGLLGAYENQLWNPDYIMSEPTLCAPLIKTAAQIAMQRTNTDPQAYTILLILTDGEFHDMPQTIDEICSASESPLSIIIVGIGAGHFGNMEKLDSDDKKLTSSFGKKCWRDIVQFLPYRKYSDFPSTLAAETLAEVPDQVVQYFYGKDIMPTLREAVPVGECLVTDLSSMPLAESFSSPPIATAQHCIDAEQRSEQGINVRNSIALEEGGGKELASKGEALVEASTPLPVPVPSPRTHTDQCAMKVKEMRHTLGLTTPHDRLCQKMRSVEPAQLPIATSALLKPEVRLEKKFP